VNRAIRSLYNSRGPPAFDRARLYRIPAPLYKQRRPLSRALPRLYRAEAKLWRDTAAPGSGEPPLYNVARFLLPRAQRLTHRDDLPEMVGVVVRQHHGLAEDRLAVSPGELRDEVGLGIGHQILHGLEVPVERLE